MRLRMARELLTDLESTCWRIFVMDGGAESV